LSRFGLTILSGEERQRNSGEQEEEQGRVVCEKLMSIVPLGCQNRQLTDQREESPTVFQAALVAMRNKRLNSHSSEKYNVPSVKNKKVILLTHGYIELAKSLSDPSTIVHDEMSRVRDQHLLP
jgi:hypothetical protein